MLRRGNLEKKLLGLDEISSSLERQAESITNIHKSLSEISRLTEGEIAMAAIKRLSGQLETDEEAIQEFIAEGVVRNVWSELTYSTESVVELGEELKRIMENLEKRIIENLEKGDKISLIKELL
jgi:hypothetical protein